MKRGQPLFCCPRREDVTTYRDVRQTVLIRCRVLGETPEEEKSDSVGVSYVV